MLHELIRVRVAAAIFAIAAMPVAEAAPRNAGAVVLVNSQSPDYAEFAELLEPYLVQFGVPYTVKDISADSRALPDAALYIVGHRTLDPARRFFSEPIERALLETVRDGAGLVSFDGVLAAGRGRERQPLYSWPQAIFGFSYEPGREALAIRIEGSHFITAQRPLPRGVTLKTSMVVPRATPGGQPQVLASANGAPLVIAAQYGSGRAVEFATLDWVRPEVKGRIYGLDDLVWRSLVWAARKPFLVRGMPKFLAFRVDDVSGFGLGSNQHLGWILKTIVYGLKPWVGVFIDDLGEDPLALQRLSELTRSGLVTASVHARGWSKFFFLDEPLATDDLERNIAGRPWPDDRMAANFEEAERFFATHGIVKSKVVLPHFYEFALNNFEGLKRWGAEFTGTVLAPGRGYGSLVPRSAPYLESGSPRASAGRDPIYIADWLRVPGHPEYDSLLFNLVVEIRDVTGYEWAPSGVPVAEAIRRAVEETRREWDSGLPGVLFTHESDHIRHIAPEDWDHILAGVMAELKPDGPAPVTLDELCRYVRALKTSNLGRAVFDATTGEGALDLEGSADVPTSFYLYDSTDGPPRELTAPPFQRRTQLRWTSSKQNRPQELLIPLPTDVEPVLRLSAYIGVERKQTPAEAVPGRGIQPGAGDVERRQMLSAEGATGRVERRHLDHPIQSPVRRDARDRAPAVSAVPEIALAVDSGAVGPTPREVLEEWALSADRAGGAIIVVNVHRIAKGVGEVEVRAVRAPGEGIRNTDTVFPPGH